MKTLSDSLIKSEYDKYFDLCKSRLKLLNERRIKFDSSLIITNRKKNPTEHDLHDIKLNFLTLYNFVKENKQNE